MSTPKKLSVKFIEGEPPAVKGGGFGGGLIDYGPLVKTLATKPGVWAMIAEREPSVGALRRLLDMDCELMTRAVDKRTYEGKDGQPHEGPILNIWARYVKGSTKAREDAKAAKAKVSKTKTAAA